MRILLVLAFIAALVPGAGARATATCADFLFREQAAEQGVSCPDLPTVIETGVVTTSPPGWGLGVPCDELAAFSPSAP